MPPNSILHL